MVEDELFDNGEEGMYNCFNPTDVGECRTVKVKIQYKMLNVNNKIDTTLKAAKTFLNFNGEQLIEFDKDFEIGRNSNHKVNKEVEINTCDRHYVDLTMKLQPIIPNGVDADVADPEWQNSKCKCRFHHDFFYLEETNFHMFSPPKRRWNRRNHLSLWR